MAEDKLSITHTALVWMGIIICLIGLWLTLFGAKDVTIFEGTIGNIQFKTSHIGLILISIGSLLSGLVATKVPSGVRLLSASKTKKTFTQKIFPFIRPLAFLIFISSIIIFIISMR